MTKTKSKVSINLSAIVYRENALWVAHCLELDIVAEGKDVEDAVASLVSLCDLQIKVAMEEADLESVFRPAPPEIWKMFSAGKILPRRKGTAGGRGFNSPVERFEARQLQLA